MLHKRFCKVAIVVLLCCIRAFGITGMDAAAVTNAVGNDVDYESGGLPMNPPKVGWWFLGLVGVDGMIVIEVGLDTRFTKWIVRSVCHEVLK